MTTIRTPWGIADHVTTLEPGLLYVGTPSHGGLMIESKLATKLLSKAARKRGQKCGRYLAYEEDCEYAVAFWELRQHWAKLYAHNGWSKEKIKASLLKTLSGWMPEYLDEIGVKAIPEERARWDQWQKERKMRADRDPDLIVSAVSVDEPKGAVEVRTADGEDHFVTGESYPPAEGLYLLSKCEKIAA